MRQDPYRIYSPQCVGNAICNILEGFRKSAPLELKLLHALTCLSVVVEVLSKTSRKFDQTRTRLRCQNIPTLAEYVLVEQDKGEIQVCSRNQGWQSNYYYLGDQIELASLDITLAAEDLYDQVDNEDVREYLPRKQESTETPQG